MTINRATHLQARQESLLAAIEAIEGGSQSWSSPDGMSYSRADLAALYSELRKVEAELAIVAPSTDNGGYTAQPFSFGCRR